MDARIAEFNELLFAWSDEHFRKMDWRTKTRDAKASLDPYRVLVSELMLQQTQVDRVRGKYAAFVARFPDVATLAAAPLADVLRLWSGLGYNRRAKYLHEAARKVVGEHDGKFPRDFDLLRTLPGIGGSTAAAIMAFAWNEPYPMIDTNVRRVLSRCFFPESIPNDKTLFAFATAMIPKGRGRAWNYAMLDVAATECTARRHMDSCPLFDLHGEVGDFVYKKPQSKFKGSKRSFRGALMKVLAVKHVLPLAEAEAFFAGTSYDGRAAVRELAEEGLIRIAGGKVRLG